MISIQGVSMAFGRFQAVDDVSLSVAAGQSLALWGPNGAGKSTIIRCVLGLYRYSGSIRIGGLDVQRHGKEARRLIGYVPQEIGFYDDLRVHEAVRFFGGLKCVAVRDPDSVLDGVGLCGHAGKRIRELSGGMKQRLALAVALLGDPPVLVLDEVTASLDAMGRDELVGLLAQLSQDGRAMLFASHRQDEVHTLADRVAILERGRLQREGSPAELLDASMTASHLKFHAAEVRHA
ncbi:MAG: ABC transporter ATP-binding protein [Phycisphaerales bacterium]|jgi:ABC-2 type transport system ATP-binding protein|nr:MAG: ABC transporter ATP-binding protein [Chloroflexota bacterium]